MRYISPKSWSHALNSIEALHAVLEAPIECPMGLEVDVRLLADVVVVRHDPFPPFVKEDVTCVRLSAWLDALAQHPSRVTGVIKLDFKEPAAADGTAALLATSTAYNELRERFVFWWNADVVPAGFGANGLFTVTPREELLPRLAHAVAEGFGLSFGWQLPAEFEAYTVTDMKEMCRFVADVATRCAVAPVCVTFAVRHAAVLGIPSPTQREELCGAIDELLQETWRLFFSGDLGVDAELLRDTSFCFLSFWRGRNEHITSEEMDLAKKRFPTCTVDLN